MIPGRIGLSKDGLDKEDEEEVFVFVRASAYERGFDDEGSLGEGLEEGGLKALDRPSHAGRKA